MKTKSRSRRRGDCSRTSVGGEVHNPQSFHKSIPTASVKSDSNNEHIQLPSNQGTQKGPQSTLSTEYQSSETQF